MDRLLIIAGPDAGHSYEVIMALTIGRDPTADIRIADRKFSRLHARISPMAGNSHAWELIDLDSSNGIWHGDQRVSRMTLIPGTEFRIGSTVFRYESVAPIIADVVTDAITPAVADGDADADADAVADVPRDTFQNLNPNDSALFRTERVAISAAQDDASRANVFLSLLHQVVVRASRAQTRDELFEVLDNTAADILDGDRCAVFLPAADDQSGEAGWELWPTHARRLRGRFGAVPFARTLLAAVRRRREPLLSAGGGDVDPTVSMVQAGVRSAMAAPLRIGDDVQALLYVDRLHDASPFTRLELEFLAAVANQLAVQLANRARVEALESAVERLENAPIRRILPAIVGDDPAIVAARVLVERSAASDLPVLILGEPGTGKKLLAQHVHAASRRAARPMQTLSCAIVGSGAETALFGERERPGALELAHGGTLFIDDVGELSHAVQSRLALTITHAQVCRQGDHTARSIDVRVIATAHQASDHLSAELRTCCAALTVSLPPLASRGSDIDLLAEVLLRHNALRFDHPLKRLLPEARTALLRHSWPGNVHELKDVLERACVLSNEQVLRLEHFPEIFRTPTKLYTAAHAPFVTLAEVEKAHIQRILEQCGGNKKAAAELLGIDRSTLYAKLKQYGVI